MRTTSAPLREAMYVATQLDTSWLQVEQRRLYERSRDNPAYVFQKLWGFVTDPRNLRVAIARVAHNKGARTAGVDGLPPKFAMPSMESPVLNERSTPGSEGGARKPTR